MSIAIARENIRRMQHAQGRCEFWIAMGRPDRGEERPCLNPALYDVPRWGSRVCCVHARGFTKDALVPLAAIPDPS